MSSSVEKKKRTEMHVTVDTASLHDGSDGGQEADFLG